MARQVLNITVLKSSQKLGHEQMYRKLPKRCSISNVRAFSKICMVIDPAIFKVKLSDHGVFGMMVRYSPQHSKGTY